MNIIEKRILGAMLLLADEDNIVNATLNEIAQTAGYKMCGGAHTYAMKMLEINNHITTLDKRKYKVLV